MKGKLATVATAAIVTSAFGATTAFADSYTVQQGDTLTQIAKKFNTTVSNLKQWNGLNQIRLTRNKLSLYLNLLPWKSSQQNKQTLIQLYQATP